VIDAGKAEGEWKWLLFSAGLCGVVLLTALGLDRLGIAKEWVLLCYGISYLAGGWDALIDAWDDLKQARLDIHFLMLIVAIGAAGIGAWWEGAALLFLFSLSGALEAMAMARTEREIRSLFRDAPKKAMRVGGDHVVTEVNVDELALGDMIRVLPGALFPIDGKVISGQTSADESMLTGEAIPVDKNRGDGVFGGTLNGWGLVDVEVTRLPSESAHAKIIRLIRTAQASKAPSQRFTDRFGTPYTLGILLMSIAAFCWWHWVGGLPAWGGSESAPSAIYRAMTLLVVCSPCALVISIPSAILSGIAAAAKRGILFRGGIALEKLATIDRLAVDKTGTLTEGEFQIVQIDTFPAGDEKNLLEVAAALSQSSTHPISRAIAQAWRAENGEITVSVSDYESITGKGVRAVIAGERATQGRRSLFPDADWLAQFPDPAPGLTEVMVETHAGVGRILLRDAPRAESAPLIRELKNVGIRVAMLTGDRPESAALLAQELALDEARASMTPETKVSSIQEWQQRGEIVAMVGDGVNDAPAMAIADVSIGMGLRGSDAVLEQADVILLQDQLKKVMTALRLSKQCRRIIQQNLVISLGVLLILAASTIGLNVPLPLGVLGHEGSTIIVVLNSLRLLWLREA
jgi:Cd2+/Zn2+-exporting ATPase